jgi:hypothetical protein
MTPSLQGLPYWENGPLRKNTNTTNLKTRVLKKPFAKLSLEILVRSVRTMSRLCHVYICALAVLPAHTYTPCTTLRHIYAPSTTCTTHTTSCCGPCYYTSALPNLQPIVGLPKNVSSYLWLLGFLLLLRLLHFLLWT